MKKVLVIFSNKIIRIILKHTFYKTVGKPAMIYGPKCLVVDRKIHRTENVKVDEWSVKRAQNNK